MSEFPELRATPINTIVNAKTGKQIATLTKGGRSEKELTTLARSLVRRCNCHDDLLGACENFVNSAALRMAIEMLEDIGSHERGIAMVLRKFQEQAEAAIAKAHKEA